MSRKFETLLRLTIDEGHSGWGPPPLYAIQILSINIALRQERQQRSVASSGKHKQNHESITNRLCNAYYIF